MTHRTIVAVRGRIVFTITLACFATSCSDTLPSEAPLTTSAPSASNVAGQFVLARTDLRFGGIGENYISSETQTNVTPTGLGSTTEMRIEGRPGTAQSLYYNCSMGGPTYCALSRSFSGLHCGQGLWGIAAETNHWATFAETGGTRFTAHSDAPSYTCPSGSGGGDPQITECGWYDVDWYSSSDGGQTWEHVLHRMEWLCPGDDDQPMTRTMGRPATRADRFAAAVFVAAASKRSDKAVIYERRPGAKDVVWLGSNPSGATIEEAMINLVMLRLIDGEEAPRARQFKAYKTRKHSFKAGSLDSYSAIAASLLRNSSPRRFAGVGSHRYFEFTPGAGIVKRQGSPR